MGVANSAAERNKSVHSFIQSKRRNGLLPDQQSKLVNVFCNTKLKGKMEQKGAWEYTYSSGDEFGPSTSKEDNEPEVEIEEEEMEPKLEFLYHFC